MKISGRTVWGLTAALALGVVGCSVLLDRNAKQCQSSADCAHFAGNPVCQAGVCVASGLGPPACFSGVPQQNLDFLNACTSAAYIPFDNCTKTFCPDGPGGDDPAPLIDPDGGAPADAGTTPSPSTDGGAPAKLPECVDATAGRGQVIYLTGSSNFPPLLAKLGPLVMKNTGYTPVYQITSSCNGVKAVFSATAKDHRINDPAAGSTTASATYVTADGTLVPCSLGTGGVPIDIGESDIFSTSCSGFAAPGGDVGEYFGPIQAMIFVVPSTSSQRVISAQMARAIFGRGGMVGSTDPWTNPSLFLVRNANTGTQQMIGHAIAVPADKFWGIDRGSAKNVATAVRVLASGERDTAEAAIGIISNDYYDDDRGNLAALFFQATNQLAGFLPDSTPFLADKRNVRDGHYPIWGPLHFFTALSQMVPASAAAQAFISVVSPPEPGAELLDAYIAAGLVPACAMSVQRDTELGPLSAYARTVACDCYFDSKLGNATDCTACQNANDCTDPKRPACRLGFCESH